MMRRLLSIVVLSISAAWCASAQAPESAVSLDNATAARWTFIIDKDGKVVYKNTKVNPTLDSKEVAAFIEKMNQE